MIASLAMYGVSEEHWPDFTAEEVKPAEPPPLLPVEVWHSEPFDKDRAQAALIALCRGN